MLTRRMFHNRLLAALAGAALPLPWGASASTVTGDDRWLNRLTFGATATSRAEIARIGRSAWLDAQLSWPATDPEIEARLAKARLHIRYDAGQDESGNNWPAVDELRPLSVLTVDPAELVPMLDPKSGKGADFNERVRPAQEVIAASMIRAVHAGAQLREVMTQFWHDHFNVDSGKDERIALFFASYDAALRTHALGNFRKLLGEVAHSPCMLYYLNNAESLASPANENYARELLELHTLGAVNCLNDRYQDWRQVPGADAGLAQGYLDLDVYEVARAFTGWSVGDGRWLAEGEEAPLTGRMHYVARWHDPYQKRVLGREFAPNRAPMADGEEVLDILAAHPATARFVCEKLARRLLADDPSRDLVERMAVVFQANAGAEDQIAQVIRVLVLSPEFGAPPTKLRRPFEFLAAMFRATGAEVTGTTNEFVWPLTSAGWRQHEYGPPTGHPDRIGAWTGASTLNRYVILTLDSHEERFGCVTKDMVGLDIGDTSLADFIARHADALVPGVGEGVAEVLAGGYDFDLEGRAAEVAPENRKDMAIAAIALAALTPDFLLR